jgi:bacillopeptidase F
VRAEWNLSLIRAPEVWTTLGISGTGAVVAGMDTGVDWLHPALQANYRGYNPHGPANHRGNWYDPVTGSLYPIDDHGHGTHTLGTAVGRDGIGVAPGARWIGVKVLDRYGYGYDSWIHAGFQWLLAPDGDPSLAPDVVNCSWGDENGASTEFQADLRALRAAGIFVVFANGNSGPGPGTVISPASLPEAFAVGAGDSEDRVANFSSRGPSPWGEVRPHVVAPGVSVLSALPGGIYGTMSGTSMATPHVAGLVALLRAVSPTVTITDVARIITATAVPLSTTVPNNDSGWGRVDAFAAVALLMNAGMVQGTVTPRGGRGPHPGATVSAVRTAVAAGARRRPTRPADTFSPWPPAPTT